MELNPSLESVIPAYEPDRLRALLVWFGAEAETLGSQSARLSAILDETEQMDINTCYELINQLQPDDMVRFSVLNEFGPSFAKKPYFNWLNARIQASL